MPRCAPDIQGSTDLTTLTDSEPGFAQISPVEEFAEWSLEGVLPSTKPEASGENPKELIFRSAFRSFHDKKEIFLSKIRGRGFIRKTLIKMWKAPFPGASSQETAGRTRNRKSLVDQTLQTEKGKEEGSEKRRGKGKVQRLMNKSFFFPGSTKESGPASTILLISEAVSKKRSLTLSMNGIALPDRIMEISNDWASAARLTSF